MPDGLNLDISIEDDRWGNSFSHIDDLVLSVLKQVTSNVSEGLSLIKFSHIELSIVLCDDKLIHELNHQYRHKDKATNVLSFPGLDDNELERFLINGESIPDRPFSLGEIFIAYETMKKEAEDADISLHDHFMHILIHGILHLLGYDHIEETDAEKMESLETLMLKNMGVDDPYTA